MSCHGEVRNKKGRRKGKRKLSEEVKAAKEVIEKMSEKWMSESAYYTLPLNTHAIIPDV